MKQIYILLIAMYAIAFTACSKDDSSLEDGKEGIITLVHKTDYSDRDPVKMTFITFNKGKIITIDWGDGNVEKIECHRARNSEGYYSNEIQHKYTNSNPYIITIKGRIRDFGCFSKHIISLDISKCPALTSLSCSPLALTSLDVSKNTALTSLNCADNNLTSLDVSGCPALTMLNCGNNNLTSLDVSKNTALTGLWCNFTNLTSLDVSGCPALTKLECRVSNLTSLDVSKNTALTSLDCTFNALTSLDVSGCPALTRLQCNDNNLSASALNKIFIDLPPITYGEISYWNNPGTDTCDKRILDYKGWY